MSFFFERQPKKITINEVKKFQKDLKKKLVFWKKEIESISLNKKLKREKTHYLQTRNIFIGDSFRKSFYLEVILGFNFDFNGQVDSSDKIWLQWMRLLPVTQIKHLK